MTMQKLHDKFSLLILICVALLINGCGGLNSAAGDSAAPSVPPAAPIKSDNATNDGAIRFLENKPPRSKLTGY